MTSADTPRWRLLAWALALLAALLIAGCGDEKPERDAAGRIEGAGQVRLLQLRVGDCISNLRDSFNDPDGSHNGVPRVKAVPCAEPHDGELLRIDAIGDGDWPGSSIVNGEAARGRQALQPRLTAANASAGKLTLLSFTPTQDRWEFEDQHEIVYLALYTKLRTATL